MADGVLLLGHELGHAFARDVGQVEQGVVAETVGAAQVVGNGALAVAIACKDLLAVLVTSHQHHRGVEARGALGIGHVGHLGQQLLVVGGIVAVLACPASGMDTRVATQRIHAQARVVGHCHLQARLVEGRLCLDQSVVVEGLAVLVGILKVA